jgi:hypothetical protein
MQLYHVDRTSQIYTAMPLVSVLSSAPDALRTPLCALAPEAFAVLNGTFKGKCSLLLGILSLHLPHLLRHILHRPACVSSLEDHVLITSCVALSVACTASNALF